MIYERQIWTTAPPEPRSRSANWPTVLFSWWCTAFATAIILIRLNGRKVRSGQLFREDWIMIAALVPLWIRMIIAHFVLIYGTNNINAVDFTFTSDQLYHHSVGARLVLASRIFYAAYIWMCKWVVSEFLKRITLSLWRKSYEYILQGIRLFLIFTFIAVVIATLAECQPFDHYWQVVPDPGPQCRQGFAQLLTMGVADIITDILLIAFPIPIIVLRSGQPWTRKLLLSALFGTSITLIVITGFRMPEVIAKQGRQQYRSVWASAEILASTFVCNFIIIGSFLRDKGTKRNKYKAVSVTDSVERASTRRPTIVAISHTDSDEDLFRSLGCRVPEHLQNPQSTTPRPAPTAVAMMSSPYTDHTNNSTDLSGTTKREAIEDDYDDDDDADSQDSLHKYPAPRRKERQRQEEIPSPGESTMSKRQTSFFDVGGLLEDGLEHSSRSSVVAPGGTTAQDFVSNSPSSTRRGSHTLLVDLGGFLRTTGPLEPSRSTNRPHNGALSSLAARYRSPASGVKSPQLSRHDTQMSLQDAGGLLNSTTTPSLSTPASSTVGRHSTQQSLVDILNEDRFDMDHNAIALQPRALPHHPAQGSAPPSTARSNGALKGYESMDLQDPGGLLG